MSDKKTLTREQAIQRAIKNGKIADITVVCMTLPLAVLFAYFPIVDISKIKTPPNSTFIDNVFKTELGMYLILILLSILLSLLTLYVSTTNKRLKAEMKKDPNFKIYPGSKGNIAFHFNTNKVVQVRTLWGNGWFAPYFDTKEGDSGSSKN